MKLNFLNIKTPKEIQLEIAKNIRKRRKELTPVSYRNQSFFYKSNKICLIRYPLVSSYL